MDVFKLSFPVQFCAVMLLLLCADGASAQYPDWKHSGSVYILTTPDGANLPETSLVKDFPLLIRLHSDHFPFYEAANDGHDIRFSTAGKPLPFEIENWDKDEGTASVWVRIPEIRGNDRREIKIHWGNPGVSDESDGKAVFDASNGYVGVWHLGSEVRDEVGNLESEDKGTSEVEGLIGAARHFPGKAGVFCGKEIETLPTGGDPHSTQVWFRSKTSNGRMVSWGNEKAQGKVQMWYRSPQQIRMDCYFSNADVRAAIPGEVDGWTHVVHTFEAGRSALYINGRKIEEGNPRQSPLAIERPARLWIGGWYDNYDFIGDLDEVRISGVARSADWVHLEYENQKPMQTLVGSLVQGGDEFLLSPASVELNEGESVAFTAKAGGAQKVSWVLMDGEKESVIATDRFQHQFDAGRVIGDQSLRIRFDAVFNDGVRSIEVPIRIAERLPEPEFSLLAPERWDGRESIEILPDIKNREALQKAGVDQIDYQWKVSGLATLNETEPGRLILNRAQNSGRMTVTLSMENGGARVASSVDIEVREPEANPWIMRDPRGQEMPKAGQFYSRDESGKGLLLCKGKIEEKADEIFLRVFSDEKEYAEESMAPGSDGTYHLAVRLAPGLVKYRVEFGLRTGGVESVIHEAGDIVCGDAYLIDGQSNALATDTREESPRVASEWVRSYGDPRFFKEGERENLWCRPVWKFAGGAERQNSIRKHKAEIGWWGMDLARQLVESQKIPVFIVNGAVGGTRIDQHQRDDENPTNLETIYGRMLWRIREAGLTHGVRAIIWHQGENDQGAAGPDGGYGWETYEDYFVEMAADWKRDFPNLTKHYIFQIWPTACSMGRDGAGDMLREKQRTLPRLFSNMEILSTLGIQPGGSCHYPLEGWSVFADRIHHLLARDFYGFVVKGAISSPNLIEARYSDSRRESVVLEFDQPVLWDDRLVSQFYFDDREGLVTGGKASGNMVTLTLADSAVFERITYLKEDSWDQSNLLRGVNGLAALTFCNVPIELLK